MNILFDRALRVFHWASFVWGIYLTIAWLVNEQGKGLLDAGIYIPYLGAGWGPMLLVVFGRYVASGKTVWWPWNLPREEKTNE